MARDKSRQALAKSRRWWLDVPLLMLVAFSGLVAAYLTPVMVVNKFFFFSDDYSLVGSIWGMWKEGFFLLAGVVFLFSVVLPPAKLVLLALAWYRPMRPESRRRVVSLVSALGKWSMLDVFVVAVLVVLISSRSLLDAEPREGLYFFAAAVLLSMLVTLRVEAAARMAGGRNQA